MSVGSPPKHETKGGIERTDFIDDREDTGATVTALRLSALFQIMTLIAETTTATLTNLLTKQSRDTLCQSVADTVKTPGSIYSHSSHGNWVFTASFYNTVQIVLPKSHVAHRLYLTQYPKLPGQAGERVVYKTMRRELYRPLQTNNVYETVSDCRECAVSRADSKRSPT